MALTIVSSPVPWRAPLLAGLLACAPLAGQGPAPTIPQLEQLARADSNDATAHYRLAMAYWDKKRWDEAEGALHAAVTVAPSYAEAHLALGVLPSRRGESYWKHRVKELGETAVSSEWIRAEHEFRLAFLLNPLVDLAVVNKFEADEGFTIVRVGGQLVFFVAPWWGKELTRGMNEFRVGKYDRAAERFEKLAHDRRFPQDDTRLPGELLWYQGLAAAHQGNFDLAVRNMAILTGRAVAAEHDTGGPPTEVPLLANQFRFILATMLYLSGRHDQALPVFHRTLEFDASLFEAHVQLARIFEAAGQADSGLAERRRALDANPGDPDLLTDYAGALLRLGRLADAVDPLAEAASANPHDPRIPYLQGIVAEALARPAEARTALERFLAIAPSRFGTETADARQRLSRLPLTGN